MDTAQRVEVMISNISGLLADPDLKSYGPRLRRVAVENYDWKTRAAQFVQAYSYFAKLDGGSVEGGVGAPQHKE